MEYQKIINLLDNPSNQLSKFRTKNSVEKIMTHMKQKTVAVKLDLKLQC